MFLSVVVPEELELLLEELEEELEELLELELELLEELLLELEESLLEPPFPPPPPPPPDEPPKLRLNAVMYWAYVERRALFPGWAASRVSGVPWAYRYPWWYQ